MAAPAASALGAIPSPDNAFTGSIPNSLSQLTSLTDMPLNNNMLIGALPDAFQSLTGLINLYVENNLFSGPVPTKLYNIPNFRCRVDTRDVASGLVLHVLSLQT
ncbi:hypothetical protein Taro_033207 [Colocasia esculenta]|uniref:Uncharacterized protein n=1 Tax=Colocasia esculenta TaxID=4460 RepID=A0A843W8D4_COLES|nr:hypothetical protein [Colocasia esculenta]